MLLLIQDAYCLDIWPTKLSMCCSIASVCNVLSAKLLHDVIAVVVVLPSHSAVGAHATRSCCKIIAGNETFLYAAAISQ